MNHEARIGQLYRRDGKMGFPRAVRQARLAFYANKNLSGFEPTECRVHPQHLVALPESVDGLPIVADETVRPDHVLVCCPEVVNA